MRTYFATTLSTLALILAMSVAAMAKDVTLYLKGTGSAFNAAAWAPVFYVGCNEGDANLSAYHIVFSSNFSADNADILEMQIAFKGQTTKFEWKKGDDFSKNGGGKNWGWVIYVPYNWEIDYVNKGNKNDSPSYVIYNDAKAGNNPQFNISGFNDGTPIPQLCSFTVIDDFEEEFVNEIHEPIYGKDGNSENTLTLAGNFGDNNINYVVLDAADFWANGYTGDVAVSFNNSGKDPKIGVTFTVKDGKVTFGKDVFKSNYSVLLFSAMPDLTTLNRENKHGNKIYDLTNGGDKIYLFFHNQGGLYWNTNVVVNCKFVDYTEVQTRPITDNRNMYICSILYKDGVALTIPEATNCQVVKEGYTYTFENLAPGTYKVELKLNGELYAFSPEFVLNAASPKASHDFSPVIVNKGYPVCEGALSCEYDNCPNCYCTVTVH